MTDIKFKIFPVILVIVISCTYPVFSEEQKAPATTTAATPKELLKSYEEAIAQCKAYNDYEKLVSDIKSAIASSDAKFADVLDYAVAKARLEQLKLLSQSNDLESGRLYMSINGQYYTEALDYLDKASAITNFKDLVPEIALTKFLVFKDKIQPQQAQDAFDGIVEKILKYSTDGALCRAELYKIADKFTQEGLPKYSIKLKVAYASKADPDSAREIFEDMRKDADQRFAKGDMKGASGLYEQYIRYAEAYFKNEELAPRIMEIAEKYFSARRYGDAKKYYEIYTKNYGSSNLIDYCSYTLALCSYYEKDYKDAISRLEAFIAAYQNSVWFDKAFETLSKLYYENFPDELAVKGLQSIVDKYYRKNVGDYAQVLIGLVYYQAKDYAKASEKLKKVEPGSIYFYSSQLLLDDINNIRNKALPSFGTRSADLYRMWDPGKPIGASIASVEVSKDLFDIEGSESSGAKRADDGTWNVEVKKLAQVKIALDNIEDRDTFDEYQQDKDDQSRLPKKIKDGSEKDLVFLQWMSDGGKFLEAKDTASKVWQAPDQPGTYKVSVHVDDFGLVRSPDKGVRKDAAKELVLTVIVKE